MSVKIQTQTCTAKVTLAEGMILDGSIFLQRSPIHVDGLESPVELLNRPEAFFALKLTGGDVVLIPKAQVVHVSCPHLDQEDDEARQLVATVIKLRVVVAGGTVFDGTAMAELPPGHSRALDFLNLPEPFLELVTDADTVYVNRSHVRYITALD